MSTRSPQLAPLRPGNVGLSVPVCSRRLQARMPLTVLYSPGKDGFPSPQLTQPAADTASSPDHEQPLSHPELLALRPCGSRPELALGCCLLWALAAWPEVASPLLPTWPLLHVGAQTDAWPWQPGGNGATFVRVLPGQEQSLLSWQLSEQDPSASSAPCPAQPTCRASFQPGEFRAVFAAPVAGLDLDTNETGLYGDQPAHGPQSHSLCPRPEFWDQPCFQTKIAKPAYAKGLDSQAA